MVETRFKHTEIGIIPEDWELELFTDLFTFLSTASYSRADMDNNSYTGYIHYGDIHTKIGYHLNTNNFVSGYISDDKLKSYSYLKQGDLLMADASEDYAGVGKGVEVVNVPDFPVISGLHTFLLREKKEFFAPKFKGYFHSNPIIKKQYDALATGLKVYSLSKNALAKIYIPIPPIPEQQAIGETLTHTDKWIESLEKLIVKKRLIKQGVMQNLLTPKKNWRLKKLGDIGKTYGGLSGKTKQDFGKGSALYLPFLNIINNVTINESFVEKVNLKQGEFQNRILKNDLLFNGSSETPEELGISSVLLNDIDNLYLNSFCFGFRLFDNTINSLFLSYLMRSPYGRKVIFFLAQGATRYNLSKSNFLELKISIPPLKEQIDIATILSDMDSEIEALEEKLVKAKQIKQGMMQELLTGKIRLIESSNQSQNHKFKKAPINM